jgi:2-succinyl-5-enolpyruvyl-6-hydroxy-3-cyclohexene-1-carboxylate synthase
MDSQAWASDALKWAVAQGVAEFCVCAGSRNGPLLAALSSASGAQSWSFFEERSAAFFALGRARELGRPVAVVTTSGTAVAECLPAAIEAHYEGVPLVFITADRPRRYRGTGAPQSIEQAGLFGAYVSASFDGEADEAAKLHATPWDRLAPFHLNICFEEPLLTSPPATLDLTPKAPSAFSTSRAQGRAAELSERNVEKELGAFSTLVRGWRRPLLVLSRLAPEDRAAVRDFALRWNAPVYAEACSGLREDAALANLRLSSGERLLPLGGFDGVLRIGGVPTMRFWRDLEDKLAGLPVASLDPRGFSGLSRGGCLRASPAEVLPGLEVDRVRGCEPLFARDGDLLSRKLQLFSKMPASEPAIFHHLSRRIPDASLVFLGNSLPIREWDLAADLRDRKHRVEANRGANGIDGQVSTFLGLAEGAREGWGVFGDLTALYDLASLWACDQMTVERLRLVVINNGGGRIFGRLPAVRRHVEEAARQRFFETRHDLGFEGWAQLWNFGFERWNDGLSPHPPGADRSVIEIRPDEQDTARFWSEYDALWESFA